MGALLSVTNIQAQSNETDEDGAIETIEITARSYADSLVKTLSAKRQSTSSVDSEKAGSQYYAGNSYKM